MFSWHSAGKSKGIIHHRELAFTLPPALKNSHLTNISHSRSLATLLMRTSGVSPMTSNALAQIPSSRRGLVGGVPGLEEAVWIAFSSDISGLLVWDKSPTKNGCDCDSHLKVIGIAAVEKDVNDFREVRINENHIS